MTEFAITEFDCSKKVNLNPNLKDDLLLLICLKSELKKQKMFTWHFIDTPGPHPPWSVTCYLNGP